MISLKKKLCADCDLHNVFRKLVISVNAKKMLTYTGILSRINDFLKNKKTNCASQYEVNDLMQSTYTRILSEINYLDGGKNYQPIHRVDLPTCLY